MVLVFYSYEEVFVNIILLFNIVIFLYIYFVIFYYYCEFLYICVCIMVSYVIEYGEKIFYSDWSFISLNYFLKEIMIIIDVYLCGYFFGRKFCYLVVKVNFFYFYNIYLVSWVV